MTTLSSFIETRLLILEEKRFERDKLFAEVCQAEEQMAVEGKQQEKAMEVAYKESREKYEKYILPFNIISCLVFSPY